MRLINGHFTVVNEQDNAKEIAKELLVMFESDRSVDQIIITREMIEKECHNSNNLLLGMIETYIAIVEEKFNKLDVDKVDIKYPSTILCTDNAAMIGSAAYFNYISGYTSKFDLNVEPNLELGFK